MKKHQRDTGGKGGFNSQDARENGGYRDSHLHLVTKYY
jgi:hypothetical protein